MIETKIARPVWHPAGKVGAGEQPFKYPLEHAFVEPDWCRLPGYRDATAEQWGSALWQRRHTVKNLKELRAVFGALLPQHLLQSMERDIQERATMSILIPPQMLNTMDEKDLWNDPVRRYMLPAFDDRHPEGRVIRNPASTVCMKLTCGPSKGSRTVIPPKSSRKCSLLVRSTAATARAWTSSATTVPQVTKLRFQLPQKERFEQMLDYLRKTPSVRDCRGFRR